jgi:RNA polymerase sigma-70 factor, ECF subfamily
MSNLIDSYLLFRLKTKRDPEAFARIYDRYVEAIYRFAILKLPSEEDAQDVTSEAFMRTWAHINDRKPIDNVRAFLYQVTRNLIADRYRQKEQLISYDAVTFEGESPSTHLETIGGDSGRGTKLMEARADFSLLLEQLKRLKEDYRDVLLLRLVDDLPFSVIGQILEKSPGNVRVIYHRALKALKELETNA